MTAKHKSTAKHRPAAKAPQAPAKHLSEAAVLQAAAKRWLALRAARGLSLQALIRQQKGR
jgi:hypothetical protein